MKIYGVTQKCLSNAKRDGEEKKKNRLLPGVEGGNNEYWNIIVHLKDSLTSIFN